MTTKYYMREVTAIDPRWLVEFGHQTMNIKRDMFPGRPELENEDRHNFKLPFSSD